MSLRFVPSSKFLWDGTPFDDKPIMFIGSYIYAKKKWIVPHGAFTIRRYMAGADFVFTNTRPIALLTFRVNMRALISLCKTHSAVWARRPLTSSSHEREARPYGRRGLCWDEFWLKDNTIQQNTFPRSILDVWSLNMNMRDAGNSSGTGNFTNSYVFSDKYLWLSRCDNFHCGTFITNELLCRGQWTQRKWDLAKMEELAWQRIF
jgi:hypothetical protein